MNTKAFILTACTILCVAVLSGCDKSKSNSAAMPETEKALGKAADQTTKALGDAASSIAQNAKATASDMTSKFVSMAKAQGDAVLGGIGQDLAAKANALVESCGANDSVKTNVQTSLSLLETGKDSQALAPAFQLTEGAGLTEGQRDLAKQVGSLASAFVVQRNFSSLPNAQGDVANLVNSLRAGQYASTLPPLKNLLSNASLTPAQKQILSSVTDKYAPSLRQAAGTIQQGLQSLPGFGGKK